MMSAIQVQQDNSSTAVIFASCTPMLPGTHWHMHRDDFEKIAGKAGADALRFFENETNRRIRRLREEYGIPMSHLPAEDDLWIDASSRIVEEETLHARSKSTFAKCLQGEAEQSLISLGFLRRHRIIARPRGEAWAEVPKTARYRDIIGEFIFVSNDGGDYLGDDGLAHNAMCDGGRVTRQYLYEINKVNTALYGLQFWTAPEPLPRWPSTIRRSNAPQQRETKKDGGQAVPPQKSVPGPAYDMEVLRTAEWCAETLIGLASGVLAVPLREEIGEATWETEWQGPAQRLLEHPLLSGKGIARQWEIVDLVTRYMAMPDSPSWWQGKRKKKTPITLRHVTDNFDVQYADYVAHNWYPGTTTPYDGPPLVEAESLDYSTGYSGVEEPREATPGEDIEIVAEDGNEGLEDLQEDAKPDNEETTFPMPTMSGEELDALAAMAIEEYPALQLGHIEPQSGRFVLCVLCNVEGGVLSYYSIDHWRDRPPEDYEVIENLAVPYGEALLREAAQAPPDEDNRESESGP